jgi:hypothetical protein
LLNTKGPSIQYNKSGASIVAILEKVCGIRSDSLKAGRDQFVETPESIIVKKAVFMFYYEILLAN